MLFANVCAGFIRSCYGEFWVWHFLGVLASLLCLVCWESASFASLPFAPKTWVSLVLKRRIWLLFGPRLLRFPLMLVVLV